MSLKRFFPRLTAVRLGIGSGLFWIGAVALGLSGCGGGGGGGSTDCTSGPVNSVFTYTAQWTTGSSGNSQVVNIVNSAGSSVGTRVLNRSGSSGVYTLSGIPSGTYRIQATLFSGSDGAGSNLGAIDTTVSVCNNSSFTSATGGTPNGVQLSNLSFSIPSNGSRQLYAHLIDASGTALFAATGSITWNSNSSNATVNASGLVQGQSTGSVQIRATHGPSGLFAIANGTITNPGTTNGKWTVLVYLNAANDLYTYSTLNVNQMEKVAGNPDVRFVLQWKQSRAVFPGSTFDGTRRVLVKEDSSDSVVSDTIQDMGTGVDMGDPQTLADFIAWGKQYYPADRYVLVVWNHGNGWLRGVDSRSVSYDDQTGNSIKIWELQQALSGQTFDIVAWDASLMQMLEVAYEIRGHASYVAGSEESPPGEGYPYDLVFGGFRDNPDSTTAALSKGFVDGMVTYAPYASRKITQSVLESAKLSDLSAKVSILADRMIQYKNQLLTIVPSIRLNAQSYSPNLTRVYRDLYHVCVLLKSNSGTPSQVWNAANDVQTALNAAKVWEGHNSNSANSRGVSIDFSGNSTFGSLSTDYRQMEFAQDTNWDEWLTVAP